LAHYYSERLASACMHNYHTAVCLPYIPENTVHVVRISRSAACWARKLATCEDFARSSSYLETQQLSRSVYTFGKYRFFKIKIRYISK